MEVVEDEQSSSSGDSDVDSDPDSDHGEGRDSAAGGEHESDQGENEYEGDKNERNEEAHESDRESNKADEVAFGLMDELRADPNAFACVQYKEGGGRVSIEIVRLGWIRKRKEKYFCFYTENRKKWNKLFRHHPQLLTPEEMRANGGDEYELARAPRKAEVTEGIHFLF